MAITFALVRDLGFDDAWTDPCIVRDPSRNPKYLVCFADSNNGTTPLYETTAAFDTFTQIDANITPQYTIGSGTSVQDIILVDGTFVVYMAVNDDTTAVLTGTSLTNLTDHGQILDRSDCGAHYHDGTFWVVTEGEAVNNEPTSNTLRLYESATATGSHSFHSTLIDVSGKSWHTGDPEFIERDGEIHMWLDNSESHNDYFIAYAKGPTVPEITLQQDKVTYRKGGDLTVVDTPKGLLGMTEFSKHYQSAPVALWRESDVTTNGYRVPISAR